MGKRKKAINHFFYFYPTHQHILALHYLKMLSPYLIGFKLHAKKFPYIHTYVGKILPSPTFGSNKVLLFESDKVELVATFYDICDDDTSTVTF